MRIRTIRCAACHAAATVTLRDGAKRFFSEPRLSLLAAIALSWSCSSPTAQQDPPPPAEVGTITWYGASAVPALVQLPDSLGPGATAIVVRTIGGNCDSPAGATVTIGADAAFVVVPLDARATGGCTNGTSAIEHSVSIDVPSTLRRVRLVVRGRALPEDRWTQVEYIIPVRSAP
ncbi:MAG: hypothetical protein HYX65_04375 [Gemmatimonadetes bacterium]|nr:hypothetical protein [Gemmatimonadota bacterium]